MLYNRKNVNMERKNYENQNKNSSSHD